MLTLEQIKSLTKEQLKSKLQDLGVEIPAKDQDRKFYEDLAQKFISSAEKEANGKKKKQSKKRTRITLPENDKNQESNELEEESSKKKRKTEEEEDNIVIEDEEDAFPVPKSTKFQPTTTTTSINQLRSREGVTPFPVGREQKEKPLPLPLNDRNERLSFSNSRDSLPSFPVANRESLESVQTFATPSLFLPGRDSTSGTSAAPVDVEEKQIGASAADSHALEMTPPPSKKLEFQSPQGLEATPAIFSEKSTSADALSSFNTPKGRVSFAPTPTSGGSASGRKSMRMSVGFSPSREIKKQAEEIAKSKQFSHLERVFGSFGASLISNVLLLSIYLVLFFIGYLIIFQKIKIEIKNFHNSRNERNEGKDFSFFHCFSLFFQKLSEFSYFFQL